MVEEAVILMPKEETDCVPPYLFAPVAGLPLLQREILGLRRVGVTSVTILVSLAVRSDLEQQLSRVLGFTDNLKLISDWDALWKQTRNGNKDNPRLAVLANFLADPRFLAKFINHPVPPGALALGLVDSSSALGSNRYHENEGRLSYPVILKEGLVTCLGYSNSGNGLKAAGVVLFSYAAWQGWQLWQENQRKLRGAFSMDPGVPLFDYINQQARLNRVLEVVSDPIYISAVYHDQDRKEASARLIASADVSPLGDGCLEGSLNRTLARTLLPWVLASPVTPNQITIASLLLGLVAALGFAIGTYGFSLAASLLLPLIMVLDCLDGTVARLKFQESRLGARLDLYGDTVLNLVIFWGIAVGQYQASGRPLFLKLGLLLTLGYLACWWLLEPPGARHGDPVHSFPGVRLCPSKLKKAGKLLEEAVSRDFFYIILLCALINCLDYLFMGIAVGTNIFALFLFWQQRHGQA